MPTQAKALDELCREGQLLTSSQGREVYAVTYEGIRAPMVVKHLSVPATQTMVSGLIYSGAVADEEAALAYYRSETDELKKELALLEPMRDHPHFLPYLDSLIKEKTDGVGFDVYLLTLRATTLRQLMDRHALTYRSALEMGVGVAEALCTLRMRGLLDRDIRPENLFQDSEGCFRLGDLGFITLEDIPYATLPDRYISASTPPELCDVLGSHNETVDTYGLGAILWTIFNGYEAPDEEKRRAGEPFPAPQYAHTALGEILCRACAPKPEDRYESPEEFLTALQGCLAEADDAPILPPIEEEPPAPEAPAEPEAAEPTAPSEPAAVEPEAPAPAAEPAEAPAESAEAPADAPAESAEPPADAPAESAEPPAQPAPETPAEPPSGPEEVTIVAGEAVEDSDVAAPLPEPSQRFRSAFAAAYEEEESFPDDLTADPSRVRGHKRLWLKILIPILCVVILAGAAFGVVYYLRNRAYTIDQLTLQIEGADTLAVTMQAPADAPVNVNLTDASGRVIQSLPYTGETVRFTDLEAGTEYAVQLESGDDRKLEGTLSGRAVTPMPTELLTFTAEALSPTEISLEFTSTGYEPEHWTLTFSNAEGQSQTSSFTGHTLVIEGLDAGETYSFTISDAEGQPVLGNATVSCTTETVVNLTTFELDDSVYGELTVRWASSGNYAKAWYLTCSGSDGSYRAEEITEQSDSFSYTFENLPAGLSYELQLSCEGLTNADDATRSIELPLCTVTDFVAYGTSATEIQVSWSFIDGEQPERWRLTCTNVGTGESDVVTLAENSFEYTGLLPEAEYRFELSADSDLLVGGCEPVTARTLAAEKFDDYATSGIFLGFFALPDKANWTLRDLVTSTNTFSASGGMAFAVEVSYQYTAQDKHVDTLYIIRDGDGNITNYYTGELSWSGSSVKETHFGGFEHCPTQPGEYTLELYFNGKLLTKKAFTVV